MLKYEIMVMNQLVRWKEQAKTAVHDFFVDENGDTNLISIVLVLVIVVGLAAIFRKNIANIANGMWTNISNSLKGNPNTKTNINLDTNYQKNFQ